MVQKKSTDSDKSYETNSGSKGASLHLYLEIRQMIRILRRYPLVLEKLGMLLCEKGREMLFRRLILVRILTLQREA